MPVNLAFPEFSRVFPLGLTRPFGHEEAVRVLADTWIVPIWLIAEGFFEQASEAARW